MFNYLKLTRRSKTVNSKNAAEQHKQAEEKALLDYKVSSKMDRNGNEFRYRSRVYRTAGSQV